MPIPDLLNGYESGFCLTTDIIDPPVSVIFRNKQYSNSDYEVVPDGVDFVDVQNEARVYGIIYQYADVVSAVDNDAVFSNIPIAANTHHAYIRIVPPSSTVFDVASGAPQNAVGLLDVPAFLIGQHDFGELITQVTTSDDVNWIDFDKPAKEELVQVVGYTNSVIQDRLAMQQYAAAVNNSHLDYLLTTQNSNSFASGILVQLVFGKPPPKLLAPGWNTVLQISP